MSDWFVVDVFVNVLVDFDVDAFVDFLMDVWWISGGCVNGLFVDF